MKEVDLEDGHKVIKTPWLRVEEAATYCGISKTRFLKSSKDLPHGGDDRTRIYHIKVLDAWMNNELDVPFNPEKKANASHRRRRPSVDNNDNVGIVNPINGKIYKPKED